MLVNGSQFIAKKSLSKLKDSVSCCISGEKFKNTVNELSASTEDVSGWEDFRKFICIHFTKSLQTKKFLLPSALWAIFFSMEKIMNAVEGPRPKLARIPGKIGSESDEELLQLFIGEFILCFGVSPLSFIKQKIIGDVPHSGPESKQGGQNPFYKSYFCVHLLVVSGSAMSKVHETIHVRPLLPAVRVLCALKLPVPWREFLEHSAAIYTRLLQRSVKTRRRIRCKMPQQFQKIGPFLLF